MADEKPPPDFMSALGTEYFVLQSTASSTISESGSRVSIYLSSLASGLVALGARTALFMRWKILLLHLQKPGGRQGQARENLRSLPGQGIQFGGDVGGLGRAASLALEAISGRTINLATGIVMHQYGLAPNDAEDLLRRSARIAASGLPQVAAGVMRFGALAGQ
jgi:hypothetical protein